MESFSKSRPTHWTAAVVTQLFPGHMFSKQGCQALGGGVGPPPFSCSHPVKTQNGREGGWHGEKVREVISVIPYDLSAKSVSNVVAMGDGWHMLWYGPYAKADAELKIVVCSGDPHLEIQSQI